MKKIQLIAILIFSLFFAFSCASDDDEEEYGNDGPADTAPGGDSFWDTGTPADTIPEDQGDTGSSDTPGDPSDSGTTDTGTADPEPSDDPEPVAEDDGDAQAPDSDVLPDSDEVTGGDAEPASDSDSEDGYVQTDPDIQADDDSSSDNDPADEDSGSDSDAESLNDSDAGPADSLPECSPTSGTPCRESLRGNIWSSRSTEKFTLKNDKAQQHCEDLEEGGYPKGSWKLPTIDELRTLISDCPKAEYEGECQVSDPGCLSSGTDCYDPYKCNNQNICTASYDGSHSKLGDVQNLWSSSGCSDSGYANYAFIGMFLYGTVGRDTKATPYYVRCIKK